MRRLLWKLLGNYLRPEAMIPVSDWLQFHYNDTIFHYEMMGELQNIIEGRERRVQINMPRRASRKR